MTVPTSEECNEAWASGYIEGYGRPGASIPTRPGTFPSGIDDVLEYFRSAGRLRGTQDRMTDLGGVKRL